MTKPKIRLNDINRTAFIVVFFPLLVSIVFFSLGAQHRLHPFTIALFFFWVLASGFGITVGFHRLLTHRSFIAKPALRAVLTALGCTAFEGPPYFWVAMHRMHHHQSDKKNDPHSPHLHHNHWQGFHHAHMGWMYHEQQTSWDCYVPDLFRLKDIKFISRHYLFFAFIGLWLPMLMNGLYFRTAYAFWEGLVFCGIIRVCLVHHLTWGINSVCHIFGQRVYQTEDQSRNNLFLGVLGLGEGWHNNHHAFPFSARHGLSWWQLDLSYLLIRCCALLGLVTRYRLPTTAQLQQRRKTH